MTANVLGCRLRVEVMRESTGQWLWAEYDNMTVESENNYYTLHVTGYHGNAGDAFNDDQNVSWQANGMPFSTPGRDNSQNGNCAGNTRCGWWFNRCSSSCLNRDTNSYWYSEPKQAWYRPIRVSASRLMLQCGAN